MSIGEIFVWGLDLLMLAVLTWQGFILLRNDREKLDIERKTFKMMSERWTERAKWREQKRKQQDRKIENEQNSKEFSEPTVREMESIRTSSEKV